MLFSFIQKYQSGGLLDTDAMKSDLKADNTLFKEGNYTAAGRKRLAAIQAIEDNQSAGLKYVINDEAKTFRIEDELGNQLHDSDGRGMALNEGHNNPLYGLIGRNNSAKKEISQVISGASKYLIQPEPILVEKTVEIIPPSGETISEQPAKVNNTEIISEPKKENSVQHFQSTVPKFNMSGGSISPQALLQNSAGHINIDAGGNTVLAEKKNQTEQQTGGDNKTNNVSTVAFPDGWEDYDKKVDQNINNLLLTVRNNSIGQAGGFKSYNESASLNGIKDLETELDRRKKGGKADPKIQELKISVNGKEISVGSAKTEDIFKEIQKNRSENSAVFTNQVDVTTKEALAYIDSEIKRLVAQPWTDMLEKKQVLDALESKKRQLVHKYASVMADPNLATFSTFYKGSLPDNSHKSYWDPDKKKIVGNVIETLDKFNMPVADPTKANTVANQNKENPVLTSKEKEYYKQLILQGAGSYSSFRTNDGGTVTLDQLLKQLETATYKNDLQNVWIPRSESYGSYSSFIPINSLKDIKIDPKTGAYTYSYPWNSPTNTINLRFKNGGKMENNLVPKAQFGMSTSSFKALQDIINRSKSGEVLGIEPSNNLEYNTSKLVPTNPYTSNQPTYTVDETGTLIEKPKTIILPKNNSVNTDFLNSDYVKNAGAINEDGTQYLNPRFLQNQEKDAEIKRLNDASAEKTKQNESQTPVDNLTDDMQTKDENSLYRQEDNKEKRNLGTVLSTTGVNTPLGEIQYGDIAQFFLMLRAKNNKLADVPVNLEKAVNLGSRDVLAARDMEASSLAQANNKISHIRSTYNGSDPVMSAIMNNQANAQKEEAQANLDVARGQYRRQEVDRVAEQMEQKRQQEAQNLANETAVQNRNNEKLYQAELAKAQDKVRRESEFMNNVGTLITNMQTKANQKSAVNKQFKTQMSVMQYQNELTATQNYYQKLKDARTDAMTGYTQLSEEQQQALMYELSQTEQKLKELKQTKPEELQAEAAEIDKGENVWRWKLRPKATYQ